MIWPKVFTNPGFKYPDSDVEPCWEKIRKMAIADGLSGWAICMTRLSEIPKEFGRGMVKIATVLRSSASPENLTKLANEILEQ